MLYSLLLYLATPLILLRLVWRARKQPAYLEHLAERWGFYGFQPSRPVIWLHAVSVGETRAAQPLVDALKNRWPDHQILLTCMTPTGRQTSHDVFGDTVLRAYLPYDQPDAVARFFRHFRPVTGILMETEIWPNLLAVAQRQGVPMVLANARLSERSARGYRRFAALARPAFASLAAVAAQTAGDAARLASLGVRDIRVCGNLKFDVTVPEALVALGKSWRAASGERPVWLAASTREGEEQLILDAWHQVGCAQGALLIIVPRHPQRFEAVAELIRLREFRFGRRSEGLPGMDTQVWLGDSMGEMPAYYAMADLAFIGGSLMPLGGQNLIEAAACACPVLVGPHTFNFLQATDDALRAGAARRVADVHAMIAEVQGLLANPGEREQMALAAQQFAAAHRGATGRVLAVIEAGLPFSEVQRPDRAGR